MPPYVRLFVCIPVCVLVCVRLRLRACMRVSVRTSFALCMHRTCAIQETCSSTMSKVYIDRNCFVCDVKSMK